MVHVVLWYRYNNSAVPVLRHFSVFSLFMRISGHLLFPAMMGVNVFLYHSRM